MSDQFHNLLPQGVAQENEKVPTPSAPCTHMMTEDDNPPVGILLCTHKDHAMVEYALAGRDIDLFISKYPLGLLGKETMQRFIKKQLRDHQ